MKYKVTKNQRRGIRATLLLLDEALCTFERWAKGDEERSALHQTRNNLTAQQKRKILRRISSMRAVLGELKDALGLEATVKTAAEDIWTLCSGLREHLIELQGKHLHRYGKVHPDTTRYLDGKVESLLKDLETVSEIIKSNHRAGS